MILKRRNTRRVLSKPNGPVVVIGRRLLKETFLMSKICPHSLKLEQLEKNNRELAAEVNEQRMRLAELDNEVVELKRKTLALREDSAAMRSQSERTIKKLQEKIKSILQSWNQMKSASEALESVIESTSALSDASLPPTSLPSESPDPTRKLNDVDKENLRRESRDRIRQGFINVGHPASCSPLALMSPVIEVSGEISSAESSSHSKKTLTHSTPSIKQPIQKKRGPANDLSIFDFEPSPVNSSFTSGSPSLQQPSFLEHQSFLIGIGGMHFSPHEEQEKPSRLARSRSSTRNLADITISNCNLNSPATEAAKKRSSISKAQKGKSRSRSKKLTSIIDIDSTLDVTNQSTTANRSNNESITTTTSRPSRRAKANVKYTEPPIGKKVRQGDPDWCRK